MTSKHAVTRGRGRRRGLALATGVTGEADDHPVELLDLLGHAKRLLLLELPPLGGRVHPTAHTDGTAVILGPK